MERLQSRPAPSLPRPAQFGINRKLHAKNELVKFLDAFSKVPSLTWYKYASTHPHSHAPSTHAAIKLLPRASESDGISSSVFQWRPEDISEASSSLPVASASHCIDSNRFQSRQKTTWRRHCIAFALPVASARHMALLQVASTRFRTRLAWFELPDDRPTTCRRGRWVVGRPPCREHPHRTPPQTNLPRTDMHPPHTHHAHTDHTAPPPPLLSLARGRAGRGRQ